MPTGIVEKKSKPRAFRGWPKKHYGCYVYAPKPAYDWDAIRRAKIQCREACSYFDPVMGRCSKNLTPVIQCNRELGMKQTNDGAAESGASHKFRVCGGHSDIPLGRITLDHEPTSDETIELNGKQYRVTGWSIGMRLEDELYVEER